MTFTGLALAMGESQLRFRRSLPWLYVVGGAIGLAASFVLMVERLAELTDPDYVPTCSINPVIACGSVMDSAQATVFGFPNPLLGIGSFAVVITVGVLMLSGFRPPRWIWAGLQLGTTFGVVFVHWLIVASLYDIQALCPYCMVVWVVTIPMFWYTTLRNLQPTSRGNGAVGWVVNFHSVLLALWFVLIAVLITQAFWDYWVTLG